MENVNINVRVVEENRPSIASFGALYGHRMFMAEKIACDLNFNEKLRDAQTNNGIVTSRSPFRYKVVGIDIVSLELDKDIDGSNVIVINRGRVDAAGNNVEVRCPIDTEKFTKEVTTDAVVEALAKAGTSKNRVFFASGKKLAEALNPSNSNEIDRLERLIADAKKQKEMIERTMQQNVDEVSAYYAQLDGKKSTTSVHVTVE